MSTDTPKIPYQKEVEVCINQQNPKTKIKMKDTKKYKAIYCMTCRTGCRISEKIWSMKVVLQSHGEALRLRIETLPVLLMNYQWSREQKWNRVRVSTVDTIIPMQKNFPGDPEEPNEVPGADEETKSHLH